MQPSDCMPHGERIQRVPIFPLPNTVLLPTMVLPLNVCEPRYLRLVDSIVTGRRLLGIPLIAPNTADGFEPVFGLGKLLSHQPLPDGRKFVRVEGLGRARLLQENPQDDLFRTVDVELLPEDEPRDQTQLEVLHAQLERLAASLRTDEAELIRQVLRLPDTRAFVYGVGAILPTLQLVLPTHASERCPHAALQQRCMAAENADARIATLLEAAACLSHVLSDSGRFPRAVLN